MSISFDYQGLGVGKGGRYRGPKERERGPKFK